MTARLLRVANSPMYNLSGRAISTVSRAVVMLGFDAVRSLCLSIAVVEAVAHGACKLRPFGNASALTCASWPLACPGAGAWARCWSMPWKGKWMTIRG